MTAVVAAIAATVAANAASHMHQTEIGSKFNLNTKLKFMLFICSRGTCKLFVYLYAYTVPFHRLSGFGMLTLTHDAHHRRRSSCAPFAGVPHGRTLINNKKEKYIVLIFLMCVGLLFGAAKHTPHTNTHTHEILYICWQENAEQRLLLAADCRLRPAIIVTVVILALVLCFVPLTHSIHTNITFSSICGYKLQLLKCATGTPTVSLFDFFYVL